MGNPTRSRMACWAAAASSSRLEPPRRRRPTALDSASSTASWAASSSATSSGDRFGLAMARSAAASSVRAASDRGQRAGRAAALRPRGPARAASTWPCSATNSSASWLARSDGTISAGAGLRMASTSTSMGRVSSADSSARSCSMWASRPVSSSTRASSSSRLSAGRRLGARAGRTARRRAARTPPRPGAARAGGLVEGDGGAAQGGGRVGVLAPGPLGGLAQDRQRLARRALLAPGGVELGVAALGRVGQELLGGQRGHRGRAVARVAAPGRSLRRIRGSRSRPRPMSCRFSTVRSNSTPWDSISPATPGSVAAGSARHGGDEPGPHGRRRAR